MTLLLAALFEDSGDWFVAHLGVCVDLARLEARGRHMRCRRQCRDEVQRHIRRFNAVLRVGRLLARHTVDEIVVPHDNEQKHEDCDEAHKNHVADRRDLDLKAGVPHHRPHHREHNNEEDYNVGEVAEDICCSPDLTYLSELTCWQSKRPSAITARRRYLSTLRRILRVEDQ